MIKKIAHSLADPGQTEAHVAETVDETQIIDAQMLRTFADVTQGPRPETVSFTLAELIAFAIERIERAQKSRSLDWAVEDRSIEEAPAKTNARAATVKLAFEKLLLPSSSANKNKGRRKGGKSQSADALEVFKTKCDQLGAPGRANEGCGGTAGSCQGNT